MKKIIFSLSALAALLLAGSCQRENLEPAQQGGTVTYTVQVPGALATKAAGDYELIYEVYRQAEVGTSAKQPIYEGTQTFSGNSVNLPLEFVKDQNFVVLFWAQKEGVTAYSTGDLRNVTLGTLTANQENYEVFAGMDEVSNCVSSNNGNVELVRPIAQLNIATLTSGLTLGNSESSSLVVPKYSDLKVTGLYSAYNVATGDVIGNAGEVSYGKASIKANDTFNTDYTRVGMNYVGFMPKEGANVEVDFNIYTENDGDISHKVSNVPVKPNYKTNIIGNLISATDNYNVTLGAWGTPDEVVELWDGKTLKAPAFDATTETWTINNGAELAWVAAFVNETLPDTKSTVPTYDPTHKFVLGKNINLGDNEFTPIGVGGKRFSSTFDGNGHIISNFKITKYTGDQAALFGNLAGTVNIKNLTIQKANIVYPGQGDFYASGLVATAYGTVTIENVIVEKSYISGNNKVAGLLAHDGVVSALNINNCHVRDCKIESLNEADGGNVGGLVGLLQAGIQHNISNSSVKNTIINAINSSNKGKRANSEFVACVFDKNDLKVVINNCEVSGNTFTQNAGVTYVSPFGVFVGGVREQTGGVPTVIVNNQNVAGTAEELAYLVNNAKSDITIAVTADLEGWISLTQNAGIDVTILGNGHKFTGALHIWGNGASDDRSLTIKNVNFDGNDVGITGDEGCIYTTGPAAGKNSYACNVTIEDCTFTGAGVAAIRQNVAGEKDWTIRNCTIADNMHSLLQVSNTNKGDGYGLLVEKCKVYSKNGANLNSTCYATFIGCEFDVRGYAVRVGVNSGGNPDATKLYTFTNCTFKSENEDGDAVVIIRKDAEKATLNFVNTTLDGNPQISGYTSATKINGIELPQQDNEIWYTATAKVEAHYYDDRFGEAQVVSNVWDDATGKGVITFDAPLTKVGTNAFYEREALTSVSFPNSVTEIGKEAFKGCRNLTSVEFGSGIKSFGEMAFQSCGFTSLEIPEGVTTIGNNAFNSCTYMTSVVIPSTVTEIGNYAFYGCPALTVLTIPEGVTYIGDNAFASLGEINVYLKPSTPPTILGNNPFGWGTIYVPSASLDAYKTVLDALGYTVIAE